MATNLPRRRALLAAAVACSLGLAACSQEGSRAAGRDQPSPKPAPAQAAGLFADPAKNTPDALRAAVTKKDWAVPVQVIDCASPGCDGHRTPGVYTPLPKDQIKGDWTVCALLPHVKDPYWLGQNEALVAEAKRTGVHLQVYEAGGYTEVGKQLDQLSNCVAKGADAVLIGAVSNEALNPKIEEIADQGVVVIDTVNGVTSKKVHGRALFDYCTLGGSLAKYLKAQGDPVNGVWFPGPSGVGSLEQLMSCFKDLAKGSDIRVLGTKYGDTGKDTQLNLVENALGAYPGMDYVLGSATTADAAHGVLKERGLSRKVRTASYYFTPDVYALLKSGDATCASAGNDLILSRIAMDMALRVLENKPFVGGPYIGTNAQVICGPAAGAKADNLSELVQELNLPSAGFRPVFNVR
ncbi:TMAO reductase system periplasmic protein TorT [Streptomyces sp. NPDC087568]|uniref:TMAO reductase system periplasmic protein TorT n=1 Tax=Streptomyces sp. NPDC087568 TaxID=3365799 RepID=UPI0038299636